jgi:hypothetical protein
MDWGGSLELLQLSLVAEAHSAQRRHLFRAPEILLLEDRLRHGSRQVARLQGRQARPEHPLRRPKLAQQSRRQPGRYARRHRHFEPRTAARRQHFKQKPPAQIMPRRRFLLHCFYSWSFPFTSNFPGSRTGRTNRRSPVYSPARRGYPSPLSDSAGYRGYGR